MRPRALLMKIKEYYDILKISEDILLYEMLIGIWKGVCNERVFIKRTNRNYRT